MLYPINKYEKRTRKNFYNAMSNNGIEKKKVFVETYG